MYSLHATVMNHGSAVIAAAFGLPRKYHMSDCSFAGCCCGRCLLHREMSTRSSPMSCGVLSMCALATLITDKLK